MVVLNQIINLLFCFILLNLNIKIPSEIKKEDTKYKQLIVYTSQMFTVFLIYKIGINFGYIILKVFY